MNTPLLKFVVTALIAVTAAVTSRGAVRQTATPLDYGYYMMTERAEDGTYPGWTLTDDGYQLSPELDLSDVQSPVFTVWRSSAENSQYLYAPEPIKVQDLYVSSDGISFGKVTSADNGINAIPANTRRIKCKLTTGWPYIAALTVSAKPKNTALLKWQPKPDLIFGRDSDSDYHALPVEGEEWTKAMEFEIPITPDDYLSSSKQLFNAVIGIVVYNPQASLTDIEGNRLPYDGVDALRELEQAVELIFLCGDKEITPARLYSNTGIGGVRSTFLSQSFIPKEATKARLRLKWTLNPERLGWSPELAEFPEFKKPEFDIWFKNSSPQVACAEFNLKEESIKEFASQIDTDINVWYDFDGDGLKEFGKYKLAVDMASAYTYLPKETPAIQGWVNFNNDNQIDAYNSSHVFTFDEYLNPVEKYTNEKDLITPIDINNDGMTDFLLEKGSINNHTVMLDKTGSFIESDFKVYSRAEFDGIYVGSKQSNPLKGDFFVFDSPKPGGVFGNFSVTDINGDGLPDFINASSGDYYLNVGNSSYVQDRFGGQVLFRDFNNDGTPDYIVYDKDNKSIKVFIMKSGEQPTEHSLISGLICGSQIWCHDFDSDGDIDILIPFDGPDNNGMSFLVMFENRGNGNFKKHENFIDGSKIFRLCIDINADGQYEVIARESNTEILWSYTANGVKIDSKGVNLGEFKGSYESNLKPNTFFIGDPDHSGIQRVITSKVIAPLNDKVNQRPTAPKGKPNYIHDARTGNLVITWQPGNDAETPVADLTYEVRIGTAPDKADILWCDALPDGTRRNFVDGNSGNALTKTVNTSGWPAGSYYISVQTIDRNWLGSSFSEYAVFEKSSPSTGFIFIAPDDICITDTCQVKLTHAPTAGYKYEWITGDNASILSAADDGSSCLFTYTVGGQKSISLRVTSPDGQIHESEPRMIDVHISKLTSKGIVSENGYHYTPTHALDMDADGLTEVWDDNGCKFLEGDSEGNYTAVRKIFNTNIKASGTRVLTDINRDGLVDILGSNVYGSGTFIINQEDKDMTVTQITPDTHFSIDMNNNGLLDKTPDATHYYPGAAPGGVYVNAGDYISAVFHELVIPYYNFIYDYNADGLPDLIYISDTDNQRKTIKIYLNDGNFGFNLSGEIPLNLTDATEMADIDGNGKPDYVYNGAGSGLGTSWYSEILAVQWDNGEVTEVPSPADDKFDAIVSIHDFDNNGCLDVLMSSEKYDAHYLVYFYPDHSWKLEKGTSRHSNWDGSWNCVFERTDHTVGISKYALSGIQNESPKAPTQVRASQTDRFVTIEWNPSIDKETPTGAMRYNLSIKRRGASGEGAYFISPLNGGKNGVAVPSPVRLYNGCRFTVATNNIPAGEYEVKVQGVDLQYKQSDFSEPIIMTVRESAALNMPAAAIVGNEVPVQILANHQVNDIDFGQDSEITRRENDNMVYVRWASTGIKSVKIGDTEQNQIYIHPAVNSDFNIPGTVLTGAVITVQCENANNCTWETTAPDDVTFRTVDSSTTELQFTKPGQYTVKRTVSLDHGSSTTTKTITVTDLGARPDIALVEIDNTTGHYAVTWLTDNIPTEAQAINVYKETQRLNVYEQVATLPLTGNVYVDSESDPRTQASRYMLSYQLSYGESAMSTAHQPIHVMINRGIGNTYNLMWSHYEGADVVSYNILNGASPSQMNKIATVSGNMGSYSNISAGEGQYYAVEVVFDNKPGQARRASANDTRANAGPRSNVVSVNDANYVTFATLIDIKSDSGETEINGQNGNSLQLIAYVYPKTATYDNVSWAVVNGSNVISIDQNGLVTALDNGRATVRAYATDGSGVYGDMEINAYGVSGIASVEYAPGKLLAGPSPADSYVTISGITEGSVIMIYDLNGRLRHKQVANDTSITVNCSGFIPGIYLIKSVNGGSSSATKFIKR